MQGVYLLHFHSPYEYASHYLGYADDIDRRVEAHRDGYGSKLTKALHRAGIGFQLARTWENGDRDFERKLHNANNNKLLCPICNPSALNWYSNVSSPALDGRHEVIPFGNKWICTRCDTVLSSNQRQQYCTAKGYYSTWKKVPTGLRTRNQLKKNGLRPAKREQPKGHVFTYQYGRGHLWLDLWGPDQVIPVEAAQP